jgi:microcystin-dependent protein
MAQPFLGEVRLMSFVFPPKNWALCNGQLLPINQNQALYSVLGTYYGGDGHTTFGLPDFRTRMPIGIGGQYAVGQKGGEATHTLAMSEMPSHSHVTFASASVANTSTASNSVALAQTQQAFLYSPVGNNSTMAGNALGPYGNSQPHENMQPYMTVSFCIALVGIFPNRN